MLDKIIKKYKSELINQRKVAEILGVASNTVSQYVNGVVNLKASHLEKLANYLRISVPELLDFSSQTFPLNGVSDKSELLKLLNIEKNNINNIFFIKYNKQTDLEPIIENGDVLVLKATKKISFNRYYIVEFEGQQLVCKILRKNNSYILKTNSSEATLQDKNFLIIAEAIATLKII